MSHGLGSGIKAAFAELARALPCGPVFDSMYEYYECRHTNGPRRSTGPFNPPILIVAGWYAPSVHSLFLEQLSNKNTASFLQYLVSVVRKVNIFDSF